jgi:hypothetical protein
LLWLQPAQPEQRRYQRKRVGPTKLTRTHKNAAGGKLEGTPVTAFSQIKGEAGARCERTVSTPELSAVAGVFDAHANQRKRDFPRTREIREVRCTSFTIQT